MKVLPKEDVFMGIIECPICETLKTGVQGILQKYPKDYTIIKDSLKDDKVYEYVEESLNSLNGLLSPEFKADMWEFLCSYNLGNPKVVHCKDCCDEKNGWKFEFKEGTESVCVDCYKHSFYQTETEDFFISLFQKYPEDKVLLETSVKEVKGLDSKAVLNIFRDRLSLGFQLEAWAILENDFSPEFKEKKKQEILVELFELTRKIKTIKTYRQITGFSLREAKELYEKIEDKLLCSGEFVLEIHFEGNKCQKSFFTKERAKEFTIPITFFTENYSMRSPIFELFFVSPEKKELLEQF